MCSCLTGLSRVTTAVTQPTLWLPPCPILVSLRADSSFHSQWPRICLWAPAEVKSRLLVILPSLERSCITSRHTRSDASYDPAHLIIADWPRGNHLTKSEPIRVSFGNWSLVRLEARPNGGMVGKCHDPSQLKTPELPLSLPFLNLGCPAICCYPEIPPCHSNKCLSFIFRKVAETDLCSL